MQDGESLGASASITSIRTGLRSANCGSKLRGEKVGINRENTLQFQKDNRGGANKRVSYRRIGDLILYQHPGRSKIHATINFLC